MNRRRFLGSLLAAAAGVVARAYSPAALAYPSAPLDPVQIGRELGKAAFLPGDAVFAEGNFIGFAITRAEPGEEVEVMVHGFNRAVDALMKFRDGDGVRFHEGDA